MDTADNAVAEKQVTSCVTCTLRQVAKWQIKQKIGSTRFCTHCVPMIDITETSIKKQTNKWINA